MTLGIVVDIFLLLTAPMEGPFIGVLVHYGVYKDREKWPQSDL